MNIAKSFASYLQAEAYGTEGVNLFVGSAPKDAPDTCMWVVKSGGDNVSSNITGERQKRYQLNVYFRSADPEDVNDNLEELETEINADACTQLSGYDTIEMEALLFPEDQDIDDEERTVGMMQVNIYVYS